MVRKLIKSLLSLSLAAPLSAFALGLGDIQLHSALSERLKANIELLSVSPAEADSISVSLASQETFAKVGIERPAILMYLQFDVVQGDDGNYRIDISSREQINEPFLNFLVEVDWKSGRVLREYTLLLDPPSGQREVTPAVTAPAAAAAPTRAIAAAKTTEPDRASVLSQLRTLSGEARETAPMGSQAVTGEGLVYGPVKAADTLWAIARKIRPSSDISVQQMMVALVQANPYAFFDGNINRLKRGYVLRIDDPAMLTAVSKAEAAREVARQTRAWQDYRQRVASRAKQRPAKASAVEQAPGAAVAAKAEPKLTLVAPEGEAADKAAPSGKGAEGVSEELMLALESSAAQRKENQALKKRLEALEGQLQDMEKIISLKDADLAALQQQLRKQGTAVELPSAQKPLEAAVTAPEAEKPELVVKAEEQPVAAAPVEPKPAAPTVEKPKPQPKPKPKPQPRPAAQPEPSFIDGLLADPMMMSIGGGTLVLVLLLLAMIIRRRRKGAFQESILSGGSTSQMGEAGDSEVGETSFLSDLTVSGMGPGPIQGDEAEVDPLTEADVFMAYGRNQQAEEVLKKARESSPERPEIAAKLLEVYYNGKDSGKFEALAEEAVASLQDNDELWGKVLAMGHELCPGNVLFEAGAGAELPVAAAAEPEAEAISESVMDIGLDLDELTAEMEGEGGSDGLDIDLGLDFSDLELDSGEEAAAPEAAEEAVTELPELEAEAEPAAAEEDFDLDLSALEEEPAVEGEEPEMDFDLDLGALEEEPAASEEAELDMDLDLGAEEESAPEAEMAEEDLGLDLGALEEAAESEEAELDIDLDLGAEEESASEAEAAEEDLGLDLGELEESAETEEAELDMDLDLGALDESTETEEAGLDLDIDMEVEEGAEAEEAEADFDLDFGAAEEPLAEAEEGEGPELEFDLDFGAEESPEAEAASEAEPATESEEAPVDELSDFESELGLGGEEETAAAAEEEAMEFDLGSLEEEGAETEPDMGMDLGDLELGDLGEIGGGDDAMSLDTSLDEMGDLDDLGDLGDLTGLEGGEDEMSTKLDLAQAYAEMGDAEGARSMLEEVIADGNDEQKQQAQALIDKL